MVEGGGGVKERPILFSGPMVEAILAGRKVQTRRTRGALLDFPLAWKLCKASDPDAHNPRCSWATHQLLCDCGVIEADHIAKNPLGTPGDRLWVREAWRVEKWRDPFKPSEIRKDSCQPPEYRATPEPRRIWAGGRWRSSIHMPRWVSRIDLIITAVRVERLADITDADARAEGVEGGAAFLSLWESIHGEGSFEKNPWVWVYEFQKCIR